jgi:two-component system LytT family response regulator
MISTLLVDDEEHNRSVLRTMVEAYCPMLKIIDEAENADEAFLKINKHKPQLVFLDIKMPGKSGFDLLKMFGEIDFEVVFVTAFDKFAVKAFEFNALGYILKPIDQTKLLKVIEKVSERIKINANQDLVLHFVKSLSDTDHINKLSVHHNDRVIFIRIDEISCVEAGDDKTTIWLNDKSRYFSSKRLSEFENVLEVTGSFMRLSKSVIINSNFISHYTKGEVCIISMKTGQSFEVSRRRKSEIIRLLKP